MNMEFAGTRHRGHPRKTWWDVSRQIWRVLACPVRMLRIGIIGE